MNEEMKKELEHLLIHYKNRLNKHFHNGISNEKDNCFGGETYGYYKGKISAYEDILDKFFDN